MHVQFDVYGDLRRRLLAFLIYLSPRRGTKHVRIGGSANGRMT